MSKSCYCTCATLCSHFKQNYFINVETKLNTEVGSRCINIFRCVNSAFGMGPLSAVENFCLGKLFFTKLKVSMKHCVIYIYIYIYIKG